MKKLLICNNFLGLFELDWKTGICSWSLFDYGLTVWECCLHFYQVTSHFIVLNSHNQGHIFIKQDEINQDGPAKKMSDHWCLLENYFIILVIILLSQFFMIFCEKCTLQRKNHFNALDNFISLLCREVYFFAPSGYTKQ